MPLGAALPESLEDSALWAWGAVPSLGELVASQAFTRVVLMLRDDGVLATSAAMALPASPRLSKVPLPCERV